MAQKEQKSPSRDLRLAVLQETAHISPEMEECQEGSQSNEGHQERKKLPSEQPVPSTGSQDQREVQEKSSCNEWDTDLEEDEVTTQRQSSFRTERYLQACRQTGAIPVSSFIRHVDEPVLNLNHYCMGPLGAKALAKALQSDNAITHLELEDNNIQAEGTCYLRNMLQENIAIQSLNLSHNRLGLKGATIINHMLLDNYNVKTIKLSGNDWDDSAAKCLVESLQSDYVVKELDLSHNRFCEAGGEHLGHILGSNVGIEVLNLSWNHLRMRGAVALCTGLRVNSTLKELRLSHNGFGRIEVESLGQALKQNSTLVLLDLSSNNIDNEAVTLLCQGLTFNSTLKVLKLSHNPMTNIGALTLLKTIKNTTNSAVEEIDISSVFVCETFLKLLEEARQRCPALDVQYTVLSSVTRNLSALGVFKKFLEEKKESSVDFFQALDKEQTMQVSTSAFRKAMKDANAPLDKRQLEWLIKKFDKNCSAVISYRLVCEQLRYVDLCQ
ncbi:uncharacterized protein PAE49_001755 [Odontesthes bonariensis]|uniref:uncharacterized protein LOC142375664 n=1 Tax=Odontesthes bonariensis TaxID=219752 RepID=UPI003F5805DB